jgi:hypothetical protein
MNEETKELLIGLGCFVLILVGFWLSVHNIISVILETLPIQNLGWAVLGLIMTVVGTCQHEIRKWVVNLNATK